MMRNRCLWLILGIVSLVSALMAFQRAQVFTNGKETREVLVSNNKVYVSVAALREAGAVVSQSGSRLDNEMIEGRVGEWLSNGTWRVRVSKVEPSREPLRSRAGLRGDGGVPQPDQADNIITWDRVRSVPTPR
jgi:hypothetical protein